MKYYVLLSGIAFTTVSFVMDPHKARTNRQIMLEYAQADLYKLMIEELTERKKEREARKAEKDKNILPQVLQPNVEVKLHDMQQSKL